MNTWQSLGSLWVIVAGIIATASMELTMSAIRWVMGANTDMIRAVGSLWTHRLENSFWPGILTHFFIGICFASVYLMVAGFAPITTSSGVIIVTLGLGWVHGIIVGLFLTIAVAEHHPIEKFRKAGFDVVFAHVVGHLVYGGAVGVSIAVLERMFGPDSVSTGAMGIKPLIQIVGSSSAWIPIFGLPTLLLAFAIVRGRQGKSNYDPAQDAIKPVGTTGLLVAPQPNRESDRRQVS